MANEQNLKPKDSNQDREEAKRNGIKGGIASGIARRKRKSMREALEKLLVDNVKTSKGEMETQDALLLALIAKGIKGDVRAIEVIRDTIGEKPMEKTQSEVKFTQALVEFVEVGNEQGEREDCDTVQEVTN